MPVLPFLNLLESQAGVGGHLKEFTPFLSCWCRLGRGLGEDPGKGVLGCHVGQGIAPAIASSARFPWGMGSTQGGSQQTHFPKFMKHPNATQLSHAEDLAGHSEGLKG